MSKTHRAYLAVAIAALVGALNDGRAGHDTASVVQFTVGVCALFGFVLDDESKAEGT